MTGVNGLAHDSEYLFLRSTGELYNVDGGNEGKVEPGTWALPLVVPDQGIGDGLSWIVSELEHEVGVVEFDDAAVQPAGPITLGMNHLADFEARMQAL